MTAQERMDRAEFKAFQAWKAAQKGEVVVVTAKAKKATGKTTAKTFLGKAARNTMRDSIGVGHNGKTLKQATKAQKTAARAWLKANGYSMTVATKLGF